MQHLKLDAGLSGVCVLAGTIFFFHLGSYGLWEPDEARYAEIAREMLSLREFVVPHLNYVPYVEKPPLLYWMTAASLAVDSGEFFARLVPALSALAGVVVTYLFTAHVFDYRRALLASAILSTAPLYAVMAQVLTTDMLLTSLTTVALFALFLAISERGRWRWLLYAAMGIGTLAKGPVAIAIPLLAGVAFAAWQGEVKRAAIRLRPISGTIVTLAIAAPWFIAVTWRVPGFAHFYFIGEHLQRFFEPGFSHGAPWYFYLPVVALGFLPWSILAPLAISGGSANRAARGFCLVAAAVVVILFSAASGKLIPYILSAFPLLAVVIADIVLSLEPRPGITASPAALRARRRLTIAAPIVFGGMGALMVVASITAPRLSTPYAKLVWPSMLAIGVLALVASTVVGVLFLRDRFEAGLAMVVVTMALALLCGTFARSEAEPLRSYASLCKAVSSRARDAKLICYHRYVQGLAYYSGRRVVLVGPPSELAFGMRHSSDASEYFFSTDDDLLGLWNAPGAKVVLIDQPDLDRLAPRLGEFQVIASESAKRAILRANGSSH